MTGLVMKSRNFNRVYLYRPTYQATYNKFTTTVKSNLRDISYYLKQCYIKYKCTLNGSSI